MQKIAEHVRACAANGSWMPRTEAIVESIPPRLETRP
jgi:hypothetical protein